MTSHSRKLACLATEPAGPAGPAGRYNTCGVACVQLWMFFGYRLP